jgi:hypothetical protein
MSNIRYTEYKKKQRGRYVWGVLQMEGRKQKFQTVGEGEGARRKAEKVAASPEDRFLSCLVVTANGTSDWQLIASGCVVSHCIPSAEFGHSEALS